MQYVGQSLPGRRLRKEDHKIDRMTLAHGHPNFRFALEAANAGTMAGPRIYYNDRRFLQIDAIVPAVFADFRYSQQCVVGGMLKPACVQQCLVFEIEQWRHASTLMLEHIVRSLP